MLKAYIMSALQELFSSKVRTEILRLLFTTPTAEFHLRELTRRSGLALRTLQRDLEKLKAIDLIVSRRDGNRVLYGANREHPLFQDLAAIVAKSTGVVPALRERLVPLAEQGEVQIAFLFGSLARDAEKSHSDVDVMIIGTAGLRALTKAFSGLAERIGREINPHVMTPEEFRTRRKAKNHFLKTVMEQSKTFLIGGERELKNLGR